MEATVSGRFDNLGRKDADRMHSEEEEPEDYPFPLTLKTKKQSDSPALNGS